MKLEHYQLEQLKTARALRERRRGVSREQSKNPITFCQDVELKPHVEQQTLDLLIRNLTLQKQFLHEFTPLCNSVCHCVSIKGHKDILFSGRQHEGFQFAGRRATPQSVVDVAEG